MPEPTWSNHNQVFSSLGFDCVSFQYYDGEDATIAMESYMKTLRAAEPGSVIVLHACAHNPTGCDPTEQQWRQIGQIIKDRDLFPVFDAAYLGFNSGSFDDDAFAIRHFINDLDMEAAVCVSFAKNMGLYGTSRFSVCLYFQYQPVLTLRTYLLGERVGCLLVCTSNEEAAPSCSAVLEQLQRAEVSNPPAYGAKIAHLILSDEDLREMWFDDLRQMSGRIRSMRRALYENLVGLGKNIVGT